MTKLSFIKDSLYNTSGFILDETNTLASESYRVCHKLNQNSGYVNFKSGAERNFYCITDQNNTVPRQVYTKVTFLSGYQYDFDFDIKINDVSLYNTTFSTSLPLFLVDGEYQVSKSGYFIPSESELDLLLKNKSLDKIENRQDIVKISVIPSNITPNLDNILRRIEIDFIGEEYSSYNSLTPEIKSFYPSLVSGSSIANSSLTDPSNASFVQGPTNSSGQDSTWIINQLNNPTIENDHYYNNSYIDFIFNTSGIFNQNNNTKKIDKCVFSIRANNSSGNITNNQDWCSFGLFVDEFSNSIGFGSGVHVNNKGGFTKLESNIGFSKNLRPDNFFSTSDLMDHFFVRMYQPPVNTKISSAQIDFYFSNDDMMCMHTAGNINHKKENLEPYPQYLLNSGKNRLKKSSHVSGFFNVLHRPMNSGEVLNYSGVLSFGNYYNSLINNSLYHNDHYNNYVFLQDANIKETINTSNDFTIMLHCSTSGNYNYLYSNSIKPLLEKYTGHNLDFKLDIVDNELEFLCFDEGNIAYYSNFESYPNNIILITKKKIGLLDDLNVYISETNGNFLNVFSNTIPMKKGNGGLYIGGSGNGFTGYIHEYGVRSGFLDEDGVQDFYDSRFNISKTLHNSGVLELDVKNISKQLEDSYIFTLERMSTKERLYENHPSIFAYNTLLTAPQSYLINLEYELNTNNPSGLSVSGFYNETFERNGLGGQLFSNNLSFNTNLSNGSGLVSIQPHTYADELVRPSIDYDYIPYITTYLKSGNNSNHNYNFKIKNIYVSFDGWFTNQTGIQTVNFVTNGYTYQDNSLDFYLHNATSSSGVDFYLKGKDVSNDYINFHTNASIIEQSGISFNSIGGQVSFDDLDFYSSGPVVNTGTINFFIEGLVPDSGSGYVNLSIRSSFTDDIYGPAFDEYYEVYGYPYYYTSSGNANGVFSSVGFATFSDFNPQGSINLYMYGGTDENYDSINMFTSGDILEDGHFNMYIKNIQSNSKYQLDMFMNSSYNQSGSINMFIEGQ